MAKVLNDYFKAMLEAKKNNLPSFVYNNKTYVAFKAKTGITIYKKK